MSIPLNSRSVAFLTSHMHLLVWFAPEDQIRTAEDLDQLISAEFPDLATHPRLYELVKKYMVHGPCGEGYPDAPCMVKGKCSKGFPKPFCASTTFNSDGYPHYYHRNDRRKHTVCV